MKKFLGRSALAAGVVAVGLLAGYWHFAELMPAREGGERALATGAPGSAEVAADRPRTGSQPATGAISEPQAAAEAPVAEAPNAPQAVTAEAAAEIAALTGEPAPGDVTTAETATLPGDGTPSFGLVRVEPDGSAVIAGRALPNSEVRLRNGSTVVARDTSGPTGDFVMTLETPLAVGDHSLTLETTGADGRTLASSETAIVSVPPRGREEELLVAVEAPDSPTRLLTVPTAATAVAEGQTATEEGPAIAAVPPPVDTAMLPPAEAPELAAPSAAELSASVATEMAAVEDEPAAEAADDPAVRTGQGPELSIAAVEIEGERIYVAGTAKPGSTVRLYLDDAYLAEAAGTGDQFIAEAVADVPVGPHVVRADEIGPDGSVIARVEVPFERPEGVSMAALAPELQEERPEPADPAPAEAGALQAPDAQDAAPASTAGVGVPETDGERSAPGDVPEVEGGAPAERPGLVQEAARTAAPEAPTEELSPAQAETESIGAGAPIAGTPGEGAVPEAERAIPEPESGPPPVAEPSLPSTAEDEVSRIAAAESRGEMPSAADAEVTPAPSGASNPPEAEEMRSAAAEPAPSSEPTAAEPRSVERAARTQAALRPVEGRVIIRRGDTLWRISRSAYGLGSRYMVIYLANGDQIRNPDLIYPGQVFRMPGGRKVEARSVLN